MIGDVGNVLTRGVDRSTHNVVTQGQQGIIQPHDAASEDGNRVQLVQLVDILIGSVQHACAVRANEKIGEYVAAWDQRVIQFDDASAVK